MPHDSQGAELQPGDIVTIPFKVQAVYGGETACNVSLTCSAEVEGEYAPVLTTNTRFTTKTEDAS